MSAAGTRSSQLTRATTADRLLGQEVTYIGRVGSAYGRTFVVVAVHADRVSLAHQGATTAALSGVPLSSIEV